MSPAARLAISSRLALRAYRTALPHTVSQRTGGSRADKRMIVVTIAGRPSNLFFLFWLGATNYALYKIERLLLRSSFVFYVAFAAGNKVRVVDQLPLPLVELFTMMVTSDEAAPCGRCYSGSPLPPVSLSPVSFPSTFAL